MKYRAIMASSFQAQLQYRGSYLLAIITTVVAVFAKLFLWEAIYQSSDMPTIAGFTLPEMITYMVMASLISMVTQTRVEHEMADEVRKGELATHLIRPFNYLYMKFAYHLAHGLAVFCFTAMPLFVLAFIANKFLVPSFINCICFVCSICLGYAVTFLISFLLGILSFYLSNVWGLQVAKTVVVAFFSGYLIPLSFLGQEFEALSHYLPFQSMVSIPLSVYLNKVSGTAMWLSLGEQLIWCSLLYLACEVLLHNSFKKVELLGG